MDSEKPRVKSKNPLIKPVRPNIREAWKKKKGEDQFKDTKNKSMKRFINGTDGRGRVPSQEDSGHRKKRGGKPGGYGEMRNSAICGQRKIKFLGGPMMAFPANNE